MKRLLEYSENLKHLCRTGWLNKGVKEAESVASHSWQMSLIALKLETVYGNKYDFNKIMKLCICHDLGESLIGDITPREENYVNKSQQEMDAIRKISTSSNFPELLELFTEYEKQESEEAQIAKDLDLIDMYIQAVDYSKKYPEKDFTEFQESAVSKIKTEVGKKLLQEIQ